MKSPPHLKGCTLSPLRLKARINPSEMVVFPPPEVVKTYDQLSLFQDVTNLTIMMKIRS